MTKQKSNLRLEQDGYVKLESGIYVPDRSEMMDSKQSQKIEADIFTIYSDRAMMTIHEELESLGDRRHLRGEDGRWNGPYIRFTQQMQARYGKLPDGKGGETRWTSFAAAFPSTQPHTTVVDIDFSYLHKVQLSRAGGPFGIGHLVNGMKLDAIGRFCAALMLPGPDNVWRNIGTINNLNGEGKNAMIFIRPDARLEPDERGRVRAISRNYWAIERDRLNSTRETEDGSIEKMEAKGVHSSRKDEMLERQLLSGNRRHSKGNAAPQQARTAVAQSTKQTGRTASLLRL